VVAIPPFIMNIINKKLLIDLMSKEGLTAKKVAKLLNRTERTVFSWRSKRNVPDWVLPILKQKINQQQK
jgi:transposase